ncbi:GIY-YIG nuclease family protein [Wenyingzhuangia sp. 2_MG-2023]|uniref:GIY-YIG nuclease family protein n=1 Tax=Wenyingzhuangia sp. 2_MG-2023 TaxID=3062639 RepID=UPI0026E36A7D|nr:GIY-YIG nuclease family protein [Wenyingzhuangia sp. 2_MG-2023]MDO6737372.1 hypothetical protein [Wenyingzhuangia sp. 2_MG-2023]
MSKKLKPITALAGTIDIPEALYKSQFDAIGDKLLDVNMVHTIEHDFKDLKNCLINNEALLVSVSSKDIVYCIWQTNANGSFEKTYIGQSKAKGARARIRNHLFKQTGKTKSKLEHVKKAIGEKKQIGFTFIEINPPFFRAAIEEYLIKKYSDSLPWNEIGKNK